MGSRSVTSVPSVQRQYFQTLDFENARAIERDISLMLTSAVRKKRGDALPVRLAGVVEEFLIESAPTWDKEVPHGRIEFDTSRQRFVVRLGTQWNKAHTSEIPMRNSHEVLGAFDSLMHMKLHTGSSLYAQVINGSGR
jgi:hypothetical protein